MMARALADCRYAPEPSPRCFGTLLLTVGAVGLDLPMLRGRGGGRRGDVGHPTIPEKKIRACLFTPKLIHSISAVLLFDRAVLISLPMLILLPPLIALIIPIIVIKHSNPHNKINAASHYNGSHVHVACWNKEPQNPIAAAQVQNHNFGRTSRQYVLSQ